MLTPKRLDIRDGRNVRGFCFLHWNKRSKRALIDVQCSIPLPSNIKLTHDSIEAADPISPIYSTKALDGVAPEKEEPMTATPIGFYRRRGRRTDDR